MNKKTKRRLYRVYIAQVNQTSVTVLAENEQEAKEKGYERWMREEAFSYVTSVEDA